MTSPLTYAYRVGVYGTGLWSMYTKKERNRETTYNPWSICILLFFSTKMDANQQVCVVYLFSFIVPLLRLHLWIGQHTCRIKIDSLIKVKLTKMGLWILVKLRKVNWKSKSIPTFLRICTCIIYFKNLLSWLSLSLLDKNSQILGHLVPSGRNNF